MTTWISRRRWTHKGQGGERGQQRKVTTPLLCMCHAACKLNTMFSLFIVQERERDLSQRNDLLTLLLSYVSHVIPSFNKEPMIIVTAHALGWPLGWLTAVYTASQIEKTHIVHSKLHALRGWKICCMCAVSTVLELYLFIAHGSR